MNNIKKINFLLCLIFSFVFLFSSVFPVEAATHVNMYEDIVLEKFLGSKDREKAIIACKFTYLTVDDGEREVIWAIENINAWTKEKLVGGYYYCCSKTSYEISKDGSTAKIFVTIAEYWEIDEWWFPDKHTGDYNLTFELSLD